MKKRIFLLCSYINDELIENLGFETVKLFDDTRNVQSTYGQLPVTLCGYTRYCEILLKDMEFDGIIFTNCCNAMQRLYDIITVRFPNRFCHMLELPVRQNNTDTSFFKKQVNSMLELLCSFFSMEYNPAFLNEYTAAIPSAPKVDMEENSIYIFGSAVAPKLRETLKEYLPGYQLKMNLCCNRRDQNKKNLIPDNPCARIDYFLDWFKSFLDTNHTKLKGIIYIASQYCDSSMFDSPLILSLCKKYDIPVLQMEEGYLQKRYGQIHTRVEAFLECIRFKKIAPKSIVVNEIKRKNTSTDEKQRNPFVQRMQLVKGILPRLPLETIRMVVENQVEIFTKTAWNNPEKIIWTNMVMPQEIFYAAGLVPINMELVAGWLASLHLSQQYIEKTESLSFSPNLCSYHKAAVGLVEEGGLPTPRYAAISSHICDGSKGVVHYFNEKYNTQKYVLNIPFHNGQDNSEYLCSQFKELITWIEKQTGITITDDKLQEAMHYTNEAREYWIKAFEIRKGEPRFPGHLSLRNLYGATFLFGSRLGVDVAKSYYTELSCNLGENTTKNKKKRLLWIHFAPLYNNKIMEYLEQELNCWIVMDITGYMYWMKYDPEKPFEGLAKRALSHFYLGNATDRNEMYRRLIKEYSIDGVVHFMHLGCRAIPGSTAQIREVAKEENIPYLELVGDCIDPRGFSEQQMIMRLEAFNETLRRQENVFRN